MADLVTGHDSALDELMERWESPLRSFAQRYLQNAADSDEVVEETFVRIYHQRTAFQPGSNFSAWIFTIAANLCRHRLRWRRRHPSESLDAPADDAENQGPRIALPAGGIDPAHAADQAERIAALRTAVADLPHEQRSAFLLYAYESLSYKEIAEVLKCSERGVESLLYRSRQALRNKLAPLFGEPVRSPTLPGVFGGAKSLLSRNHSAGGATGDGSDWW
jgi:RNA polymerase sigma-70 factor (ECF subfamily)